MDCSIGNLANAIEGFIANNTSSQTALENIIQFINKKPIESVNEIVIVCGDYVSSKQIPFKHRAMELINEIIDINVPSIQMKLAYFLKKALKDISCVPLSIEALFKLYTHCYNNDSIIKELVGFVNEMFTCDKLNLAAYNQKTRNYGLKLLLKMIASYSFNENEAIKTIGVVIDCIDGEKDPRNLIMVFDIVPIVYKVFPYKIISSFDKMFYDILIDYYPIDFTPPKNSPDTITPKDLADKLNEALAIEHFASFYFEDINQYDSTPSDVFSTIQAITSVYSNEGITKYYSSISNFIINTIMNNTEEDIHIEGLVAYNYFIKRICLCEGYEELLKKTFDYLADQLYSVEDIKRSCDAKDFLCVLIEHSNDSVLIDNSFELIVKTLSHFLLTKKHFFLLKNINSLLFFCLRKIEGKVPIINDNKKLFIIIQELLKEIPNDKETFSIVIIDILSAIAVKCQGFYKKEETNQLLKDIKSIYYSKENMSMVNLTHIAYCISKIIKSNPEFDWSNDIISNTLIKNKIVNQDIVLLKALLMSNDERQAKIFAFLIENIDNEEIILILHQICRENFSKFKDMFEANSAKLKEVIVTNCYKKEYYPLINELVKQNAIIDQQSLLIKILKNDSDDNNLIDQYALIKEIILNGKINHDIIYDLLLEKYWFQKEISNNNYILKKVSKCIFLSIKSCSIEKKALIKASTIKEIESFFNEVSQSIILNKEPLLSRHLNAFITDYKSDDSSNEVMKLIDTWFNKFTSLSLTSPIITSNCFFVSKLFKIPMPIEIREMIQIKLKSNDRTLEKPVLSLLLNIYSKQESKEMETESDILLILYSKALLLDIQAQSSIKQIKRLLSTPKNRESFRRGYSNTKDVISKLILLFHKETSMELKVEILKLLGLLKNCIEYDENYFRNVVIELKKCLSDRKRKVRQMCGIVTTIWNLIE